MSTSENSDRPNHSVPSHDSQEPAQRPVPRLYWHDDDGLFAGLAARIRYRAGDALTYNPHTGPPAPPEPARESEGDDPAQPTPDDPASESESPPDAEDLLHSISLVRADGTRLVGAAALLCARTHAGRGRFAWWSYRTVPACAAVLDALYSWAAGRRIGLARASRWLIGADLLPARYRLTRWLTLRLIGVTALCAFLSMYAQLDGLVSEAGILPAAEFMERVESYAERMERRYERGAAGQGSASASADDGWQPYEKYLRVPTLLWFDASDETLHWLTLTGVLLSLLLILDIAPGPMLLGLWLLYLSLITAGGTFFMYQWDILLLEALLVAMLFAPWRRVRPRLARDREPTRAGLWAVRLLVFKLMLLSGLVKYLADDPTWNQLTALEYHFFTQPIPSATAYYAHHVPDTLLAFATGMMFFIELVLPFFMILGARRLRILAGLGTIMLMLGIGATGNYGFFNLLTVALAISLFDDAAITGFAARLRRPVQFCARALGRHRRAVSARVRSWLPARDIRPDSPGRIARTTGWLLLIPILWTSGARSCQRVDRDYEPGDTSTWLLKQTGALHSINSYGLFARMTTTRPEIVLEGSRDGVTWKTYHFEYKPTAPGQRPPLIGPHMPRLDWQMWFAALRSCQRAAWFHSFLQRLLEGRQAVRALLAHDPFGDQPPTYLRSTTYRYTFTDLGSDNWWRRERIGRYCPTVTLRAGQLVPANLPAQPAGQ